MIFLDKSIFKLNFNSPLHIYIYISERGEKRKEEGREKGGSKAGKKKESEREEGGRERERKIIQI